MLKVLCTKIQDQTQPILEKPGRAQAGLKHFRPKPIRLVNRVGPNHAGSDFSITFHFFKCFFFFEKMHTQLWVKYIKTTLGRASNFLPLNPTRAIY